MTGKDRGLRHLDEEALILYLSAPEELSEDERRAIEEHLDACEGTCADKVARWEKALLDPIFQSWTAQTHGEAYRETQKVLAEPAAGAPVYARALGPSLPEGASSELDS